MTAMLSLSDFLFLSLSLLSLSKYQYFTFFLQCTAVVDQYFDTIWDLVKSELVSYISIPNHPHFNIPNFQSPCFQDNNLICKQIGVCNSTLSLLKFPVPKPKLALPKQTPCDMCKLAVTFLQQYVNSNTTEVSYLTIVSLLCWQYAWQRYDVYLQFFCSKYAKISKIHTELNTLYQSCIM